MRSFLTLIACLLMVVTAWGGAAEASGFACADTVDQVAVHVAGDCDEVPSDADRNYPHCHTGCHGHHVAAPIATAAPARPLEIRRGYSFKSEAMLTAHELEQTLRPPQA